MHMTVNTVLYAHLTALVKKGFHGNCETDAGRKLIENAISALVADGKLTPS